MRTTKCILKHIWVIMTALSFFIFFAMGLGFLLCGYDKTLQPLLFRYNYVSNGKFIKYEYIGDNQQVTINYESSTCTALIVDDSQRIGESNQFTTNSSINSYQLKSDYSQCFFYGELQSYVTVGIILLCFSGCTILIYVCSILFCKKKIDAWKLLVENEEYDKMNTQMISV